MAVDNKGLWPYRVEVGDILIDAKGNARAVRSVSYGKSGLTTHVSFSIKRRSWTGRCHTCMNYVDLKNRGFKPAGAKVVEWSGLDKLVNHDIYYVMDFKVKWRATPEMVRGIR